MADEFSEWTDPEAIQRRYARGQSFAQRNPGQGAASPLAGLVFGITGGLENLGAHNAAQVNKEMERQALAGIAGQKNEGALAQYLMGSKVPHLQQKGLGILSQSLDPVRQQQLAAGQEALAHAREMNPLERQARAQAIAHAGARNPLEIEQLTQANAHTRTMNPIQERQATAGAEKAEEAVGDNQYRLRAAQALQMGLKFGTPDFQRFVLTGQMAQEKGRQFSVSDITKLTEEGGKFSSVAGFGETFKDDYGGYKFQGTGDLATWLGRNMPGVPGAASKESAAWWQGYDRYKNQARNDLFGSALTATEQAAFEKADVNPGMHPDTIRTNLETQRKQLESAAIKKANALIQAGYDPAPIAAAYGLDLKKLGVTTDRTKGATAPGAPQSATAAPAATTPPPQPPTVPDGSMYSPSRKMWRAPDGTLFDEAGYSVKGKP